MRVLPPTAGQTTDGTWLEVSSSDEVGAQQWWYPPYPYQCPTNDSAGTGTCDYIGGSGDLPTIDIFFPSTNDFTDDFTAGDDAIFIDAVGTFQITSCWHDTSSCNPLQTGAGGVDNSAVETYLEIDQLNPNGSVCQMHRAYTEQHPNGDTFDINKYVHHQPLYFHVIAPVSQTCGGSRKFGIDLHVQWEGGNPIKIDGGRVNVINSVRQKTTTVPSVTGDTEAQADAAIQAAGLTAVPVNVIAPAAKGVVVGQNAPAGTVEPTGSPVQITVSLGPTNADHSVTRPDDYPEPER
jgi:hypothetical protein